MQDLPVLKDKRRPNPARYPNQSRNPLSAKDIHYIGQDSFVNQRSKGRSGSELTGSESRQKVQLSELWAYWDVFDLGIICRSNTARKTRAEWQQSLIRRKR